MEKLRRLQQNYCDYLLTHQLRCQLTRRSEGRRTRGALQHTAIISDFEYKSFAISVRFAVCAAEFAKLASIIINGLRVGINALRVGHVN